MFSQTAEYALRAVVWLAGNPDSPSTNQQIAKGTHVPPDYLSKVLQALGRQGIVLAQRGKNGGFTLSAPPETLTILDVVNAVDPFQRIRSCPLQLKAHGANLCPLHRRMDQALDHIECVLRESTIADLLQDTAAERPLCEIEVMHA